MRQFLREQLARQAFFPVWCSAQENPIRVPISGRCERPCQRTERFLSTMSGGTSQLAVPTSFYLQARCWGQSFPALSASDLGSFLPANRGILRTLWRCLKGGSLSKKLGEIREPGNWQK